MLSDRFYNPLTCSVPAGCKHPWLRTPEGLSETCRIAVCSLYEYWKLVTLLQLSADDSVTAKI